MRSSIAPIRRVRISRLAPTGEGISRDEHGVGFVSGALPGEEVDARVDEVRRTFWRGHAVAVLAASRDRVLGPDAGCPGCDWGHFDVAAAREAKRALFLETMQRIGRVRAEAFGDLPIVASPTAYRIRNRFHLEGRGPDLLLGQFATRTHRVEPVTACSAISVPMAALLPAIRDSLAATGVPVSEFATLENMAGDRRLARVILGETSKRSARAEAGAVADALRSHFAGVKVVDGDGRVLQETGEARLELAVKDRPFAVSVDSFFQGNRHLAAPLLEGVLDAARLPGPGEALDAFGGVGFFAAALLEAGHATVSVEGSASAARDAAKTRLAWPDAEAERWRIVPSSVSGFLASTPRRFDVVVADPPRAGLAKLARPLAERARSRFVYVSCEPSTLARDLADLAQDGFAVEAARLYDLFPLTHRVEAVVTLARATASARR